MAGPGAKWAELWWQPKSFVNLLMTRRDFRFGGGALLAVLRFVYGRVQKRIAVRPPPLGWRTRIKQSTHFEYKPNQTE